jgi:hypothetical protein
MSRTHHPYAADSAELLLGSDMLLALEDGRMGMRAVDYHSIASFATDILDTLDTASVVRLRQEGPSALRAVAENALHGRGIVDWSSDRTAHVRAVAVWCGLRNRIVAGAAR